MYTDSWLFCGTVGYLICKVMATWVCACVCTSKWECACTCEFAFECVCVCGVVYTCSYIYVSVQARGYCLSCIAFHTTPSAQSPSLDLKLTNLTGLAGQGTPRDPPVSSNPSSHPAGLTGTGGHMQLLHQAGDPNSGPHKHALHTLQALLSIGPSLAHPHPPALGYLKQLIRGTCSEG